MGLLAAGVSADLGTVAYALEWVGLVVFLWFAIFKFPGPMVKTMIERQEARIRDSLESGARAREEGERLLAAARERLERAREEAAAIVDQARRSAAQVEEEGRRLAEDEASRIVARAEVEIGLERSRLAGQVAAEVSEVVLVATDEVVRHELDAAVHRRLVDEAIQAAEQEAAG